MIKLKVEIGKQFNILSINEKSIEVLEPCIINLKLLQEFIDDFDDDNKEHWENIPNDTTKSYTLELIEEEYGYYMNRVE